MDGLPITQVSKAVSESSAVIVGDKELARFDTELSHWVLNVEPRKNADVFEGAIGRPDHRNTPDVHSSPANGSAPLYLAKNDPLAPGGDRAKRQGTTKSDIVSSFDQRPARVFVDSPARIERDTDDPSYRLANRAYQATATIARTGPIRYWTAWRADNTHAAEGPGNFAVLAYSDNGGESVKEYGYLTYSPSHPGNQIVDPMLWTDPKGRLWLFYGVLGDNKLYDGIGGAWAVICDDPNAEDPNGASHSVCLTTVIRDVQSRSKISGI